MNQFTARSLSAVAFLGLAVLAGTAFQSAASPAPAPMAWPPTKVAVVDVFDALSNLAEFADKNKQFEAKGKGYSDSLKALNDKIKQIDTELETVISKDDIKARAAKIAEQIELKAQLEARGQAYKQLIELEQGDVVNAMYHKLTAAVKALAEKEGIDLVLFDDSDSGPRPNAAFGDNRRQMENRQVLYASPSIDITTRLVTIMNNDYATGGKP